MVIVRNGRSLAPQVITRPVRVDRSMLRVGPKRAGHGKATGDPHQGRGSAPRAGRNYAMMSLFLAAAKTWN
jgi:hypothetical protein